MVQMLILWVNPLEWPYKESYCAVHFCCFVQGGPHFERIKSYKVSMTIQITLSEIYFPVMLFSNLCRMVPTFEPEEEILERCLNETIEQYFHVV